MHHNIQTRLTQPKFGSSRTRAHARAGAWLLSAALGLFHLAGPLASEAATVWTGPTTTFTQSGIYPNPPGDRDQLTPHVALTRGSASGGGSGGIFNAVTESSFAKGLSPADTQWAVGSLANYATLTYTDWTTCGGGNPVHNLPGQQLVVHLISDDIYLSLTFTSLPSGPGFSYTRSTPATGNVSPSVTITNPLNGATFTAPANVTIQADASDSDGSVTNVLFYDGTTLLGGTNSRPYTITVNLAVGPHSLTAVATDNLGASTTSSAVGVTVNAANTPPSVTITNPINGASFVAPASVAIQATASDSDGSVTNVSFFDGGTLLGGTNNAPYAVTASLAAGPHALTAVAKDNLGLSATSSVVNVTVSAANVPPSVTITNPLNGAVFVAPASVTIRADAHDSDGTVTNVQFFNGTTSLGNVTVSPYNLTVNLPVGTNLLTAVASDNLGLSTTSSVVNVTVHAVNVPPSVTLTNPADNSVFGNTDSVRIGASASDTDGTVTNVQIFNGTVLLRSFTTAPFTFNATGIAGNLALGTNTITAVATDNLGASITSAPVHVILQRYLPPITNGNISLYLIPVATNMSAPDYAISPPGDTHRLFVVEQNGLLRIIQDGTLLPDAALNITNRVQPPLNANSQTDERGFLGLAFHPGFNNPTNPGYRTLYTYNSELIPTNTGPTYPLPTTASNLYMNVINEWKISSTNDNVVDLTSRRPVISFGKNAQNHNGGTCTFGPDGYMYLALGDGGDANDVGASHIVPGGNAQNLITPLGKFLRFDPLNPILNTNSPDPISPNGQYRIPASNPFHGAGQVPEIYAYGLRNPYRFCFDFVTGDLIHADVGQNDVEEIDRIIKGGNYGWAVKEGTFLFNMTNNLVGPNQPAGTIGTPPGNNSPGVPAGLIDPISGPKGVLEYDHNEGISITGGFVYRGSAMPELYGKYIFGDLALKTQPQRADGRIFWADLQLGTMNAFPLVQFGGTAVLPSGLTVHGFGQDGNGELYALATNTSANGTGGVVYKLALVRLTAQVIGNQLNLSWPVAGATLQTQSTGPGGGGIGTNWTAFPGSTTTNHVVVPINPSIGSAFFRLALP